MARELRRCAQGGGPRSRARSRALSAPLEAAVRWVCWPSTVANGPLTFLCFCVLSSFLPPPSRSCLPVRRLPNSTMAEKELPFCVLTQLLNLPSSHQASILKLWWKQTKTEGNERKAVAGEAD